MVLCTDGELDELDPGGILELLLLFGALFVFLFRGGLREIMLPPAAAIK
jgi:hypothetical protein